MTTRTGAKVECPPGPDGSCALVVLSAKDQGDCELHPEEARLLNPNVSPKRKVEFALGRAAARLALKQIGFDNPPPVLQGRNLEPVWPEGIAGSITHCYPWTMVIAAKRFKAFTVGIDLESVKRMRREDIGELICLESELDWVHEDDNFWGRLTMMFSAKEAIFKAFFPLCRRYIDFKEVRLSWISERKGFLGEFLSDLGPDLQRGCRCEVGCRRIGDFIFTYLLPEPLFSNAASVGARLVEQ